MKNKKKVFWNEDKTIGIEGIELVYVPKGETIDCSLTSKNAEVEMGITSMNVPKILTLYID